MGGLKRWFVFHILSINEGGDFSTTLGVFRRFTATSSAPATTSLPTSTKITKTSAASSGVVNISYGLVTSFHFWWMLNINLIMVSLKWTFICQVHWYCFHFQRKAFFDIFQKSAFTLPFRIIIIMLLQSTFFNLYHHMWGFLSPEYNRSV